jgi:hypothetical protein
LWGDVGMVGKRVVAGVPRYGVSVQPMKAMKIDGYSDPRRNGGQGAHLTCQRENDARRGLCTKSSKSDSRKAQLRSQKSRFRWRST